MTFTTIEDIRRLQADEVLRLVIITKNGKRTLSELYWTLVDDETRPGKYKMQPSYMVWTNDNEWETKYQMTYQQYVELIDKGHIKAYYYKN